MKNLLRLPLAAALFTAGALLGGCNSSPSASQAPATPAEQARLIEKNVLDQHETLMAQADQAVALAAKLQATPNPPHAVVVKLGAADQAMMTWMHNYQAPDSTAPASQRLTYLRGQQQQLDALAQQLNTALTAGKAALQQQPDSAAAPAKR